jgi:hypothetical protein
LFSVAGLIIWFVFVLTLILLTIIGTVYGAYWTVKSLSYSFFYEDMVERTVVKMVKPECLKEKE